MPAPGMLDNCNSNQISERRCYQCCCREDIESAQNTIIEAITACGYDQPACFAIRLALEEAVNNAVKHGNRGNAEKTVALSCQVDQSEVVIDVEDEGVGFDPASVPDPTRSENVEIPAGRGIMLMRAFMTDVVFLAVGNHVRMTYTRLAGSDESKDGSK